jgi:hypothetical protein
MLDTTRTTDAVRALLARLSIGAGGPAEPARVPGPVWETGPGHRPLTCDDADPEAGLPRAEAHAAFHAVATGPEPAPLDAALAVFEAEVDRLRRTVLTYGEALKSIEVYGRCAEARGTAARALRRAPERLHAAPPVPHLDHIARGLHG